MNTGSLRPLLSSILLAHLAAAASTGCSDDSSSESAPTPAPAADERQPTPPLEAQGFERFSCGPFSPGAAAALGLDSLEVWSFDPYSLPEFGQAAEFEPRQDESDGEACVTAPDQAVCLLAIGRARAEPPQSALTFKPSGSYQRVILTRGGEVISIDNEGELLSFLGPIDTLDKLSFFARYASPEVPCEYVKPVESGFELAGATTSCYDSVPKKQRVQVTREGELVWFEGEGASSFCLGRRPAGLCDQALGSNGTLGRFFERQAYLEGASIEAFERFARELTSFGAPPELVAEAHRSRADEVRHQALAVSLGRRFDPSFACRAPEAAPAAPRSLSEFALENAVEGCVRETWGALLAQHQAARATDGAVRFACEVIADDETRHAELAWATHRWLLGRLDANETREIERRMRREAERLVDEVADDGLAPAERVLLGLPSPAEARALLAQLDGALWAAPLAA